MLPPILCLLCSLWIGVLHGNVEHRFFRIECSPADQPLALLLADALDKRVVDFHSTLGIYPADTVKVVLVPNEAAYREWTRQSGGVIEFSKALYDHRSEQIVVRSPRAMHNYSQLTNVLLHEYLHARVDHLWPDAPLWFHEGMAVYFSEGIDFERSADFAWNYLFGLRQTIEQMRRDYPANPREWGSYYTQSAMAVRYLWSKHRDGFYRFMDEAKAGRSFESSFMRGFGQSSRQFSDDFERFLKREILLQVLLASTSLFWGVMPLIMILGYLRKKLWKDPKAYRRWENEEQRETEPPGDEDEEPPLLDKDTPPYTKGRPKFFQ